MSHVSLLSLAQYRSQVTTRTPQEHSPSEELRGGNRVKSSWNVMAHGDAREGKWRGNWRMEWVASTLHTTSEHGVSSINTTDAQNSAASSRLNWRPRRFKWTRPFRRKTKSGFCARAIIFQLASTVMYVLNGLPFHSTAVARCFWLASVASALGRQEELVH